MSDIRANTISDTSGNGPINLHKQSAAKAWVNYDGRTPAVERDSFNVASVSYSATGIQEVNYTNNFTNGGYAACASSTAGGATHFSTDFYKSNMVRITTKGSSGSNAGSSIATVAINGDLA